MMDIVARLENATAPDREIDLAISVAVNFRGVFDRDHDWRWGAGGDEIEGHADGKRDSYLDPAQFVPCWTGSVDAAMKLVPSGWFGSIPVNRNAEAWLRASNDGPIIYGKGATSAIALCAAALKAHAGGGGTRFLSNAPKAHKAIVLAAARASGQKIEWRDEPDHTLEGPRRQDYGSIYGPADEDAGPFWRAYREILGQP